MHGFDISDAKEIPILDLISSLHNTLKGYRGTVFLAEI